MYTDFINEEDDFVEAAIAALPDYLNKENTRNLLTIHLDRLKEVEIALVDLAEGRLLENAEGAILDEIGIPKVISLGQFTIDEAIDYVKKGFKDPLAEDDSYVAEGLVLKTPDGLLRKNGDRIIFKIKHGDFEKYLNKYGTLDKVEQIPNPNY